MQSSYWNTYKERKTLNDIISSTLYYIESNDDNDSNSTISNLSEVSDLIYDNDYDNMSYLFHDDLSLDDSLSSDTESNNNNDDL